MSLLRLSAALFLASLAGSARAAGGRMETGDPDADQAKVKELFQTLVDAAGVPFDVRFNADFRKDGVTWDCGSQKSLTMSNDTANGMNCLGDQGEYGVVSTSKRLFRSASNPDQIAGILAHEIGHIAHDDSFARRDKYIDLWKQWIQGLPPDRRKKLESELTGANVNPAARQYWTGEFLHDRGKDVLAFDREQEAAADAYSCDLIKRAGFDPIKASGAFIEFGDLTLASSNAEFDGLLRALSENTHPAYTERAEYMLRCGLSQP
jgi:hypothetical protein